MCNTKYNGWSNYATWRVNLEIIDGISWVREDFVSSDCKEDLTPADLVDTLENAVEEAVIHRYDGDNGLPNNLMRDYAEAFLAEVDYNEIAKSVMENYPEIVKYS